MTKKNTILTTVAILCVITSQTLMAQNVQNQQALSLVRKNAAAIGLTDQNIINSRVSDTYVDALSGATLVYLQQTYMGIDVDKSLQVLAFKNGSLVSSSGKRLDLNSIKGIIPSSLQKDDAKKPSISAQDAIQAAARNLNLPAPQIAAKSGANQDFSKPTDFGTLGISQEGVTTRLVWIEQRSFERVKLVWEVNIDPLKSSDSWRVMVDAKTGNVIKKENYTIYDNWHKSAARNPQARYNIAATNNFTTVPLQKRTAADATSVSYRVVPFPVEAPNFPGGTPSLVTDPWNLSPAGSGATTLTWNDDGLKQYVHTRGNNVVAQEDENGDDSVGARAKGTWQGNHLYFDFMPDFDSSATDSVNRAAAITNLFYWNNIMHDLSYQYGFDEVSGNFQRNNLGRGGEATDNVFADAQDGISFDNSTFRPKVDGKKPRMQMFLFDADPRKGFKINSPASIAGNIVSVESAVSPNNKLADVGPVTGNLVLYDDVADTLHNGCAGPANANALKGNIAFIRRGTCDFASKILNAQNAGAVAVVVMDNIPDESPFIMGGDDSSIVVPAVMISYEDGQTIREVLSEGTAVNVTLSVPPYLDGDFDAGVICHEYTHGISTRLTGGPSRVTCLFNAENLGEGWSDYIALMHTTDWSTAKKTDGKLARPLGTYVSNEPPNGPGIRQYPYSTDTAIDPHTYADVAATGGEPHAVGEIWASILWDMTWLIIQDEGVINKDIFNAQAPGGNSIAYKLVIEGMKLQPCSPGFVDGRDAILKADTLLYGGAHACDIWRAFAHRGVGVGASQGSSEVAGDETVDFKQGAIFITKHAPATAAPGGELEYAIGLKAKAVCKGNIAPNYSVTDMLPANVKYVSSDGNYHASNGTVTFRNIDMNAGDSITYKLKVKVNDNAGFPDSVYLRDFTNTPGISKYWDTRDGDSLAWDTLNLGTPDFPFYFYYSNDASVKDNDRLVTAFYYVVPGVKTTFRFWHEIANQDFFNGGVLEISADSGKTWQDLGPYMDPNGVTYNETIYGNSILFGRRAFSGFVFGYTMIDLSSFAGKGVKIRFRYATSKHSFSIPDGGTGWIITDISLSATATIPNTAWLYNNKDELKGYSSVETKVVGNNLGTDFIAVKRNEKEALLTWQQPGELSGKYQVERSTDNGVTFKALGSLNTKGNNTALQSYNFSDASPTEGMNLYRIRHTGNSGAVDYSAAKAVIFDKAIQVYPNPAKDKLNISIPGNSNRAVTLQLTDALGNQIKTYKVSGEKIELKLPVLSAGAYYLNVIKTDGASKHKIIIE